MRFRGLTRIDHLRAAQIDGLEPRLRGDVWYADSVNGNDNYSGKNWDVATATIAAAYALCSAGDTIALFGSFSENVVCAKAGVTFIGMGTGYGQARWTGAADTIALSITAAYVSVYNIRFSVPAYDSGLPSAIQLGSADYAKIIGNRFQGKAASWNAIYSPVANSDNVEIIGNEFLYMNTVTYGCGILGVEASGAGYSGWKIIKNTFHSCVIAVDILARGCTVYGNTIAEYGVAATGAIGAVLAMGIDLSGTDSGANMVWGNQLGGTYSATLYVVGASGDQWAGNYNVLTGGLTAANPS